MAVRTIELHPDPLAEIKQLRLELEEVKANQDLQAENMFIQLQLINDIRKDLDLQPLQRDRAEILRALLAVNNGKMSAKEARQKMHLSKATFSVLLSKMIAKGYVEKKPYYLDRTQNIIIMR